MVTPPTNDTIARRVRVAMTEAEESEKSTSLKSGVALTTLRRRLSGGSPFTTDELVRVARVLGRSVVDFLADEEQAAS